MKAQVVSQFPFIDLTIMALLIFFSIFLLIAFWTFRKGGKEIYAEVERIPLEGGGHE